jgi:hypothetical protein
MKSFPTLTAVHALALACSYPQAAEPSSGSQLSLKAGQIIGTAKNTGGKALKTFSMQYPGFEWEKLANSFGNGSLIENVHGQVEG